MGNTEYQYGRGGRGSVGWLGLTLGVVAGLVFFLYRDAGGGDQSLVVYCATGVKKAVEEAAGKFEQETGVTVSLEYASSGVLANKLKLDKEGGVSRGDVYIPADDV